MAAVISWEQLNRFHAAYAACIDDDLLESWPAFFTEDCFYKVTTLDNYRQGLPAGLVYADSRRMLADRVSALREANIYERQRYRHLIGSPVILAETGDATEMESPFIVARIMHTGQTDLFATGKYVDRLVRASDGQLRLASRIAVCDSIAIDTLLAIPL